jgi:membrane fusion protein, multidrug efflux system
MQCLSSKGRDVLKSNALGVSRFLCLLACVFALLFSGCDAVRKEMEKQKQKKAEEKTEQEAHLLFPVEVVSPERRDMADYVEPLGWVEAERKVEVIAKGMGECLSLAVETGDAVEEGRVLAQLDSAELKAQIGQSEVSVKQSLFEYDLAKKRIEAGGTTNEVELKKFALDQAKAALDVQKVQLAQQTIQAPIAGVVTARTIQKGMLVSSGTPVVTIVDPTSYILPIDVPERQRPRLSVGQEARVHIDAHGDEEFTAQIRRIDPNVNAQQGTVRVILDFEEAARALLLDGAFARVRLIMEVRENVLSLPKDVLIEESERAYVMVVREKPAEEEGEDEGEASEGEDGAPAGPQLVAERIEVERGLEEGGFVEIVSGLDASEQVVSLGQHSLKPGAAVKITDTPTELKETAEKAEGEAV